MTSQGNQHEAHKSKTKIDQELHQQLEQTIPASDPLASTQPGSGRKPDDQAAWDAGNVSRKKV